MNHLGNILYTPHPTEDNVTGDDIEDEIIASLNPGLSDRERWRRTQLISAQLRRLGLVDPWVPNSSEYAEAHLAHLQYVHDVHGGRAPRPDYEAALIIAKAAALIEQERADYNQFSGA